MAGPIRASWTKFGGTQDSYTRNESFAQIIRIGIVENHHHKNHSGSLASEFLIEHTDDEFQVKKH